MFNFLDLFERSATGEQMAVADWDFGVAMAVRRLVKNTAGLGPGARDQR